MNYACSHGCTTTGTKTNPPPRTCQPHGAPFVYEKALSAGTPKQVGGRGKGLKKTARRESAAERRARERFNEVVLGAGPCYFRRRYGAACEYEECGGEPCPSDHRPHRCEGLKDAHHLIPKNFIRQRCSGWPERDLLAVLYNPLLGAPLCRAAHEAIEARTAYIYWDELNPELLEYVSSLPDFMLLRLELESPKREVAKLCN